MEISGVPENYSGVMGAEAMFVIDGCDPAAVVGVEISGGDGSVLGRKRLSGDDSYRFGVGAYAADMFDPEPYAGSSSQLVMALGRCAGISVRVAGMVSPMRYMTAGRRVAGPKRILTDRDGVRTIAVDEPEELAFVAPGCEVAVEMDVEYAGEKMGFALMPSVMPEGMGCAQICLANQLEAAGIAADTAVAGRMEVRCVADGEVFGRVVYRVVPPRSRGVRICWLNSYGALDYYTFAETVKYAERSDGSGRIRELISYCETPGTLGWLAGVAASPRVWMVSGGVAEPVEVSLAKAEYGDATCRRITVGVRQACRSK